jgi:uncharacterized protein YndB with AHSA1/START domain
MTARTFEPGPLATVDFHADGNGWTLTFVRNLQHPPEKVWSALTDPTQLEQWAPFNADRDLAGTGPATLTMVSRDESMPMSASVIRADRPNLLEYTWGPDLLQWRLEGLDEGTRLTLRHTVANRELGPKVAAGWHICLVIADHMLAGAPIGRVVAEDAMDHGWQDLHDEYAARLGLAK